MDKNYWTKRKDQHELIRIIIEECLHIYDIVLDLVGNLHDQVLKFSIIDPSRRGGSQRDKKPNIALGRIEGHKRLMKDYFVENPIYDVKMFRQRFRMLERFLKQK